MALEQSCCIAFDVSGHELVFIRHSGLEFRTASKADIVPLCLRIVECTTAKRCSEWCSYFGELLSYRVALSIEERCGFYSFGRRVNVSKNPVDVLSEAMVVVLFFVIIMRVAG